MTEGFDFRDMLEGAGATIGSMPKADATRFLHAAEQVALRLGELCDDEPDLPAHLVLGGAMSLVCSAAAMQAGPEATRDIVASWRRLLDRFDRLAR